MSNEPEGKPNEGEPKEKTFTQADLDRIVADRVSRERAKFADYDELKSKAEGAKTADQRIADLEKRVAEADAAEARRKLVAEVAKTHKITDPRDLVFLTGSDKDTLTAQAARLAERQPSDEGERRANYVPSEGKTTPPAGDDSDMREFARQLFESNKE